MTESSRFHVSGQPDAPAIMFLHAAGWTWRMWQPQLDALADDFRVLALDLPGHGRLAHEPFHLDTAVGEVAEAIRQETTHPPLVVGLSLGGFVAMAHACRYPADARGLVLAGCSVSFAGMLGPLTRASAWTYDVLRDVLGPHWIAWLVRRQQRAVQSDLPAYLAAAQIEGGFYLRDWGQALLEVVDQDFRTMLRCFSGPILVLNGDGDKPNLAGAASLAACLQHASAHTIAHAGHMVNLHNPGAFTQAIRDFAHALFWGGDLPPGALRQEASAAPR